MTDRSWEKWDDPAVIETLEKDWVAEKRWTQRAVLQNALNELVAGPPDPRTNKVVLEVGCGLGHDFAAVIKPSLDRKEIIYYGIDVTPGMVEECRHRFPNYGHLFSVGDVYNIDRADNSVDLLYCADVLVHIPDWEKAFAELARVCYDTLVLKLCYIVEGETRVVKQLSGFFDVWFNIHWVVKKLSDLGFKTISISAVRPEESRDKTADLRQVFVARRG